MERLELGKKPSDTFKLRKRSDNDRGADFALPKIEEAFELGTTSSFVSSLDV